MQTSQKGWRRVIGAVALVVACATTGFWIHSLFAVDAVQIPIAKRTALELRSEDNRLQLNRIEQFEADATMRNESVFDETDEAASHRSLNSPLPESSGKQTAQCHSTSTIATVPFIWLVVPPMVLGLLLVVQRLPRLANLKAGKQLLGN